MEIAFVKPETWSKYALCKRQFSWYRHSKKSGLYLIVSGKELDRFHITPEVIITNNPNKRFKPPVLPDREEQKRLINRESYINARPDEWEQIEDKKEDNEKWLRVMGIRGVSYEELFITHSANHANFIEPEYYIVENGEKVPYSLGKTTQICSACLEFYNIIGLPYRKKLVVPCPGAVIFAGMAPNHYYEVKRFEKRQN